MIRLRLLLAALLLLPLVGRAQVPARLINLNDQKISMPAASFYVERVLDLRANRGSIGWVQVGMNNIRQAANLRGGAANGLTQWLRNQLPARPGARPVTMRLYDLRLDEQTGATSEKATVTLDLDFVVRQPDSAYYQLLRHADEETRTGLEVTASHAGNLAACVRRALERLQALNWEQRLQSASPIPAEKLRYRNGHLIGPPQFPILAARAPRRGLYADFLAFRRNAPDTTTAFVIEKKAGAVAGDDEIGLYTTPARTPLDEEVWGFSDGRQAYIRHRHRFHPLRRIGGDFAFDGRAGADAGAVGTAGYLGSAAGALIAAAATTGQLQEYTLDIVTGRVSDFEYLEEASRHDTATVTIFRRKAAKGQDAGGVSVWLNGREAAVLAANDFVAIPWTNRAREVTLTVPGRPAATCTFIPDFAAGSYVELRVTGADAAPTLEPVAPREGDFTVKQIQRTRH